MTREADQMIGTKTADSQNPIQDLSGVDSTAYANPYDAVLQPNLPNSGRKRSLMNDDVQKAYELHRTARNGKQKAEVLSPEFKGFIIDPIKAD